MNTRTTSLALAAGLAALAGAGPANAASPVPKASTGAASGVQPTAATLTGTVRPENVQTVAYFQYGPTTAYGGFSGQLNLPPSTGADTVKLAVLSLAPDTKYHYRIVAVNSFGTARGTDHTFTTAKIPLSLSSLVISPNPVSYGGTVSVVGVLAGTGNANRPVALLYRVFPFTAPWAQAGNTVLTNAAGGFLVPSFGLTTTTQYEVVAVSSPTVAPSPIVTANVAALVSAHVHHTRTRHLARFTGTVTPVENGAGVSIERLAGGRYVTVGGTIARGNHYRVRVRVRHRGIYRVVVNLTGAQTSAVSTPLAVR
jgi:hypothetical protein